MGAQQTPREKWVETGLTVLSDSGIDAVRIEPLAKALGVTKGGFYGYFKNRDALLQEMLATWERESVDETLRRASEISTNTVERARLAGQLTFSDDRLFRVDQAVRDWARRDPAAAASLRRVDTARMDVLREAVRTFSDDPLEVEARSLLAFCTALGTHLIDIDHPHADRHDVLERASAIILNPVSRS